MTLEMMLLIVHCALYIDWLFRTLRDAYILIVSMYSYVAQTLYRSYLYSWLSYHYSVVPLRTDEARFLTS